MAKFVQALIGMGSGKLGSAILYKVSGTQLARSYVPNVNDKNSQAQRDVRYGKFLPAVSFCSLLKYFDGDVYPTTPSGRTRFGQMLKDVFPAFGGTEDSPTIDLTLATIGNGGIPMKDFLTLTKNTDDSISATWDTGLAVPSELATDRIKILLTSPTEDLVVIPSEDFARSAGAGVFTVPTAMVGLVVTCSSMFITAVAGGNETCSKVKIKGAIGTVDLA